MKAGTAPFRLLGFGNSDKFVACWRSALTTKLVRSIFVLCCAERVAQLMEKNNCWNLLLYLQKNIYVCQHWILTFLNPKLVENCVFWSSSMKLPHFHSCLVVFWRKLRNENDCLCYILLKKLKVMVFHYLKLLRVCCMCVRASKIRVMQNLDKGFCSSYDLHNRSLLWNTRTLFQFSSSV